MRNEDLIVQLERGSIEALKASDASELAATHFRMVWSHLKGGQLKQAHEAFLAADSSLTSAWNERRETANAIQQALFFAVERR